MIVSCTFFVGLIGSALARRATCTHRLSNKPFLIWLLTTPPHLKYVATIHCSLWLIAGFDDTDVSQGSVATYTRFGVGFEYQFNYKFTTESYSEIFIRLRFYRNNGHESVSSLFLAHPVV